MIVAAGVLLAFLSSPELTVEIKFEGAAIWHPAAGSLTIPFSTYQITFRTTPFSFLHLLNHCRKCMYPTSALHTVCFSFWMLNWCLSKQVLAVVL